MKGETIRTVSCSTGIPVPYRQVHIFERGENYCMEEHSHKDFWHLNYVMEGRLQLFINGKKIEISKNNFFAIPAGTRHKIVSEYGYCQIGVDIFPKGDDRNLYKIVSTFSEPSNPVLVTPPAQKFDVLFDMIKNPHMINITNFLNIYERIILEAVRQVHRDVKGLSAKLAHILLENNPFTLTLKDVCVLTNYSKTQLERLAKKELGCGITSYLNDIKLNEICTLLQESDLTLSQIAERVCLCDAGHVAVFFKRHMGISPGKYRKIYQNSFYS